MGTEIKVGVVEKFFSKPSVAAISVEETINIGDSLKFKGATTDFEQKIESMQVDLNPVEKAEKGTSVGIKVKDRVRPGDEVFKIA